METNHTPGKLIVHVPRKELRTMDHLGCHDGDTGVELLAECNPGGNGGYMTVVGYVNCQPHKRILSEVDAARLARCWNCHDDLLAALEKIAEYACVCQPDTDYAGHKCQACIARAAIAKAKGE